MNDKSKGIFSNTKCRITLISECQFLNFVEVVFYSIRHLQCIPLEFTFISVAKHITSALVTGKLVHLPFLQYFLRGAVT